LIARRQYRDLKKRLQLYAEVMRLRRSGFGYKQISKIIKEKHGISLNPGMICNWIKGRYHPLGRRCNKLIKGAELAYVIGGWLGDGTLALDKENHKQYIILSVKDFDFAAEWGRCLAIVSGRSKPYMPYLDEANGRWKVRASNALLYAILKDARKNPLTTIPYLEQNPDKALQGLFDAEGNVDELFYRIRLFNTNIKLIRLAEILLRKIGISSRIYACRQPSVISDPRSRKVYTRKYRTLYHLVISRRENIVKFARRIGFRIRRKQEALESLLRKYHSNAYLAHV